MRRTHTVVDSPIDRLTLVATDGRLSGIYMVDHRRRPPDEQFGDRDSGALGPAIAQLAEYFAGQRTSFELDLTPDGTPFQRAVWASLQEIPYGETRSYGELAVRLGRPGSARAVGHANGANPISIVVPCHRVVGTDGSLTGYGGGLERKRYLLGAERAAGSPSSEPKICAPRSASASTRVGASTWSGSMLRNSDAS